MKKRNLFFILTAFILCSGMRAQELVKDGTSFLKAIPVTYSSGQVSFTDMRNTLEGPPWYYKYTYYSPSAGQDKRTDGNVIYYRLVTKTTGDFIIHHWDSELGGTSLLLVTPRDLSMQPDPNGYNYPVYMVDCSEAGTYCNLDGLNAPPYAMPTQGYIHVPDLPAGVYYIISSGYKATNSSPRDGNICTTIIGSMSSETPEDPGLQPEHPNNSTVQYQYDLSGNRTKTIKKK